MRLNPRCARVDRRAAPRWRPAVSSLMWNVAAAPYRVSRHCPLVALRLLKVGPRESKIEKSGVEGCSVASGGSATSPSQVS